MPHSVSSSRDSERRVRRSDLPSEALVLALAAAAERNEVETIVVTDDEGCLVASSDRGYETTPLAAALPFLAAAEPVPDRITEAVASGAGVHTVRLGPEVLHVGAAGGTLTGRGQALTACGHAVRRILAH